MGAGYVGVGPDGNGVPHAVPQGGGGHRHLGELRTGDGAVQLQVAVFIAHHDVQGGQHLGGLGLRGGGGQRRRHQTQDQHRRQQTG